MANLFAPIWKHSSEEGLRLLNAAIKEYRDAVAPGGLNEFYCNAYRSIAVTKIVNLGFSEGLALRWLRSKP